MMKKGLKTKRVAPDMPCRRFFYNIVNSKAFEVVIISSIIINTLIMSMRYFNMPSKYQ